MRTPPLVLRGLLLLGLLALCASPGHVHAEDDGEMGGPAMAKTMLLGRATVLASPGTPPALDGFLPGGKRPERLRWPLPDRPVVVLGLPHQDDVAQQVADAFQMDTDDLDGGYRIAAWRDKRRPMVIVMAADAAALAAARFEFDTAASMEMAAPDMRSLDFKKPNQEAGVSVHMGTRLVRPRFAYRAWAPYEPDDKGRITPADITEAAGAHANRLWFRLRDLRGPQADELLQRARRHGVTPVLRVPMGDATVDRSKNLLGMARFLGGVSERAFVRLGIRHFVFEFTVDERELPRLEEPRGVLEARWLETLALEFAKAEEMIILPAAHADILERTRGKAPRKEDIRNLRIRPDRLARMRMAWSGWSPYALHLQGHQAEVRAHEAGMPIIVLDRWARPYAADGERYVPSQPRGYRLGLERHVDGVVVMGRRGAGTQLESLWKDAEGEPPSALLDEAAPAWPDTRGSAWALAFAKRVAELDRENLGLLPWLKPLTDDLSAASERPCWVLPRMKPLPPMPYSTDEIERVSAWDRAATAAFQAALPNGFELNPHVTVSGLEIDITKTKNASEDVEPLLRLVIRDPHTNRRITAEWTSKGWTVEGSLGLGSRATDNIIRGRGEMMHGTIDGLVFDRYALGGDLHTGRVLEVGIHWGPKCIWPPGGKLGATAPWIIGPVGRGPLPPVGMPQPKRKAKAK